MYPEEINNNQPGVTDSDPHHIAFLKI